MSRRVIAMLGTSEATAGGVSAVIRALRQAGLFQRYPVVHIATHCDGSAAAKLRCALGAFVKFVTLLASGRIALVHVHGASNASFWRKFPFIMLALATRRKVIYHLHGGGFLHFYAKSGGFGKRCIRRVLEGAAVVIAVSDYWLEPLHELAPKARIRRIYNPLSDASLLDLAHTEAMPQMLFLGRLDADKGIYELLGAFADVHGARPELRLAFGGDGDLAAARARAAQLGIDKAVEFHGWVGQDARRALLQSSSVFVLPSYMEGLPMALLEAMAAGLPVIASRVGGVPDLVKPGVEGLLVEPRDQQGLARAMARMFEDEAARRSMGIAARERIRKDFVPETIVSQIGAVYDALLND